MGARRHHRVRCIIKIGGQLNTRAQAKEGPLPWEDFLVRQSPCMVGTYFTAIGKVAYHGIDTTSYDTHLRSNRLMVNKNAYYRRKA